MLSSNFSPTQLETALIGLAVLAFFIVRQFSTRRVTNHWNFLVPVALGYFGAQGLQQLDSTGWLLLAISTSVGIGLGFLRGMSSRVWISSTGDALVRSTRLTLVLWLATIAVKFALSFAEVRFGLATAASISSTAEALIPAAATLAAQSLVVFLRAQDQRVVATI